MMRVKSKHLGSIAINNREVGFFSPPHDEVDLVWVEVEELARAFLPKDAARKILRMSQEFDRKSRAAETALKGNKIVTIISHPMAQGLCEVIDRALHGYVKADDEWGGGPCLTKYCIAAGHAMYQFMPLPQAQLVRAFHNGGGPNLRGSEHIKDGELPL